MIASGTRRSRSFGRGRILADMTYLAVFARRYPLKSEVDLILGNRMMHIEGRNSVIFQSPGDCRQSSPTPSVPESGLERANGWIGEPQPVSGTIPESFT